MGVDTTSLYSAAYGSLVLNLETARFSSTPIIKDGTGRIGTTLEVTGQANFDGADPTDYLAKQSTIASILKMSGQHFEVRGLDGTVLHAISPAQAVEGGPHITHEILPGSTALHGIVRFTVRAATASTGSGSGDDEPADTYNETITHRPDGLWLVRREGEINGPNSHAAFVAAVAAQRARFPLPYWVLTYSERTSSTDELKTVYSIDSQELVGNLPVAGASAAVSGTWTESVSRDEQQRKVTRIDIDLLCNADPSPFLASLRPTAGLIVRESSSLEYLKEYSLKLSYEILASGSGDDLLNFQQTVEVVPADTVWEERTMPGLDPVLVQKPKVFAKLTQSGSALGLRRPKPALPIYPDNLLDCRRITFSVPSQGEYGTAWSYVMYAPSDVAIDDVINTARAMTQRPAVPEFYA